MSFTVKAPYGKTNGKVTKEQYLELALKEATRIARELEDTQGYDIAITFHNDTVERCWIVRLDVIFRTKG